MNTFSFSSNFNDHQNNADWLYSPQYKYTIEQGQMHLSWIYLSWISISQDDNCFM